MSLVATPSQTVKRLSYESLFNAKGKRKLSVLQNTTIPTRSITVYAALTRRTGRFHSGRGHNDNPAVLWYCNGMTTDYFTVRQPKFHLVIFIIGAVFFSILFLVIVQILKSDISNSEKQLAVLIFLPILLLCPARIILWYRYKIDVEGRQITARSYFGKKKTFSVSYITTVKVKNKIITDSEHPVEHITAFHENEKLFSSSTACNGYYDLVSYLKDKGAPFDFGRV